MNGKKIVLTMVMVGTVIVGLVLQNAWAEREDRENRRVPTTTTVRSQIDTRLLQDAQTKYDEGSLKEAELLVAASMYQQPAHEAFELYVNIQIGHAVEATENSDYASSMRALSEASHAVQQWKQYLIQTAGIEDSAAERLLEAENEITLKADEVALKAMQDAKSLRDGGRRWWWRDKREPVIKALVILDAVDPELLSQKTRHIHSRLWTIYYSKLGKCEIEKYKVRSNLENS